MSSEKNLKEAIDQIKEYRNRAQAASDAQLALVTSMVKKVKESLNISSENRTDEQKGILDLFVSLGNEIDDSIKSSDNFNKATTNYIKALNILNKMASSENENK